MEWNHSSNVQSNWWDLEESVCKSQNLLILVEQFPLYGKILLLHTSKDALKSSHFCPASFFSQRLDGQNQLFHANTGAAPKKAFLNPSSGNCIAFTLVRPECLSNKLMELGMDKLSESYFIPSSFNLRDL